MKDTTSIEITKWQLCPKCIGSGTMTTASNTHEKCDVCNGKKIIPFTILKRVNLEHLADKYYKHKFKADEGLDLKPGWRKIFMEACDYLMNDIPDQVAPVINIQKPSDICSCETPDAKNFGSTCGTCNKSLF